MHRISSSTSSSSSFCFQIQKQTTTPQCEGSLLDTAERERERERDRERDSENTHAVGNLHVTQFLKLTSFFFFFSSTYLVSTATTFVLVRIVLPSFPPSFIIVSSPFYLFCQVIIIKAFSKAQTLAWHGFFFFSLSVFFLIFFLVISFNIGFELSSYFFNFIF